MKLVLTQTEIEAVLLDCFCNGALGELYSSGIDYGYNKEKYQQFKVDVACYEDNLINLLKGGGRLKFVDVEGGDNETFFLTLQSATEKLSEITDANIIEKVKDILTENGNADAWHGYEILQFVLFGEVIYG
jgi:hypothetical protein